MSGPNEPYEVEGTPNPPPPPPPSGAPADPTAKPRLFNIPLPKPSEAAGSKGKIEAPKLLEDFPEDADFDKDPEMDRVITGKSGRSAEAPAPTDAREEFVKPGLGNAKAWAIVGTVLMVGALVATGASGPEPRFARIMLTLYNTLLHTGTGVVAVFAAAALLRQRFGNLELGAARMYAAVAAFSLLFSLRLTLFDVRWLDNTIDLLIASAVYVLLVCSTFGLWKRTPLVYVVGSHFFLWMIVQVGMMLSAYVAGHTPVEKEVPRVIPAKTPAEPAAKPPATKTPPTAAPTGR